MKTICVLSGGLDSTVLLYSLLDMGHHVVALSVDYGQRHRKELQHAARIAKLAGVEHQVVDLAAFGKAIAGASSQVEGGPTVPEGHYTAENMRVTVVPNRNMVLLSVAAAVAVARGFGQISYAAHAGDHAIYPDCRPAFVNAMRNALRLATSPEVLLHAPFLDMSKADIARAGAALGAPLGDTWSCYQGGEIHCGRCGTCVERREAFDLAGVHDPTDYRDREFWREAAPVR